MGTGEALADPMSPAVGIGEAWPYNRNKPGSGLGVGRVAEAAVVPLEP
jgi:hypothetical protein